MTRNGYLPPFHPSFLSYILSDNAITLFDLLCRLYHYSNSRAYMMGLCTIHYGISHSDDDFEASRGANQGEWILATTASSVQYIASKDADPCVLVFIHGINNKSAIQYGCVAHVSVAEKLDSLSNMIDAMEVEWQSAKAYLISGKSNENTEIVKNIYNLLSLTIPFENIQVDLANKTTHAVMDLRNASLYKANIPLKNYAKFDPEAYFRAACIGIFFPERKRDLIKTYDSRISPDILTDDFSQKGSGIPRKI